MLFWIGVNKSGLIIDSVLVAVRLPPPPPNDMIVFSSTFCEEYRKMFTCVDIIFKNLVLGEVSSCFSMLVVNVSKF